MLALYIAILRKVTPCAPVAELSMHAIHCLHSDCDPHKAALDSATGDQIMLAYILGVYTVPVTAIK